ncbi:SixA phosphatase family protein [Roseibium aggregatum]|uniref:Histidine phosphatase family protein n=1 Tax=Roseibium aggregatum TaxID=187304 RepID=A0A926S6R0_9HYPH|nr:histidine phosphatase family protein [Roseibium aggregatum]MBD1547836.1 histidine phosphatase family protein [Roseibium aggregatum]
MLRLLLLRHAKSDWGDPSQDDIDRPLNARGRAAARTIAAYFADQDLLPDLILCSSAQRTRETLAHLLPFLDGEYDIRLMADLYDQNEDSYVPILQTNGGSARTLLLIGHNPAIEETALALVGSGPEDAIEDLGMKFPTGALAVLDFQTDTWAKLKPESGHLDRFVKPRNLEIPDE